MDTDVHIPRCPWQLHEAEQASKKRLTVTGRDLRSVWLSPDGGKLGVRLTLRERERERGR